MHNLTYLMDLCEQEAGLNVASLREDVSRLAPFAVDERYPGSRRDPPPEEVEELIEIAEDLFSLILDEL